jgi:hypothetical protein
MPDAESSASPPGERPRPLWNVISVALPLLVVIIGVVQILTTPFGGGDYAGRLGSAVLLIIALGIGCGVGFMAAVIALIRGERWTALSWLGAIGNGAVLVPMLNLAFQD